MSKIKLVIIVLLIATIAWLASLGYAATQVRTQRYLSPGDRFIYAWEVCPTDDPTVWQLVKHNGTINAEFQEELTEPLNAYVAKAIEIAGRPIVVVVNSEQDWENLTIKDFGVYGFEESYYLFKRGVATMHADFIVELETVDLSKIGIAGIPLGACWVISGVYHFKQKKTSPTTHEEEK